MGKKFKAKPKKRRKIKIKLIIIFLLTLSSLIITIKVLAKINLPPQNPELLTFLIETNNPFLVNHQENYSNFHKLISKIINIDFSKPFTLIMNNYKGLTETDDVETLKIANTTFKDKNKDPTIYIYNSHDTEEYRATSFAEYSIMPTVKLADYVVKEELEKKGFNVLIEETTISSIRSSLGLNYAGSYQASRVLMEQAKVNYPSLKYFIDLHRDSVSYDKSLLTYNAINYAKILFIVGLENPNYQENLAFTEQISEGLNSKVPGLSRGIYQKKGAGVNGIYNQDFSNRVILVELGGPENTIDEVYESLLVLSEVLSEVITNDQS